MRKIIFLIFLYASNNCLSQTSQDYYKLGNISFNNKKYDEAIINYNKAIEINPENAAAYYCIAITNNRLRNYNIALYNINKAIEIDKNNIEYFYCRGLIHVLLSKMQDAINDFNIVIDNKYLLKETYFHRGGAKFDTQDFPGAIEDLSKSIKLDPKDGYKYYSRGLTYGILGQKKKACKDYRKAIAFGVTEAKETFIKDCK